MVLEARSLLKRISALEKRQKQLYRHVGGGQVFRRGPVYDVRAFGALGDGTTDDTPSIQATIYAIERAGGGTMFFSRPGSYQMLVDSAHIIGSDIEITGVPGAVVQTEGGFTSISGQGCATFLLYGANAGATVRNINIHHLKFKSQNPHGSAKENRPHAVRAVGYVENLTIEKNWFESYATEVLWAAEEYKDTLFVKDNYFTDLSQVGADVAHAINLGWHNAWIRGNIVKGGYDAVLFNGSNAIISYNIALDPLFGIDVGDGTWGICKNVLVEKNYVRLTSTGPAYTGKAYFRNSTPDGTLGPEDVVFDNNIAHLLRVNAAYGRPTGFYIANRGRATVRKNYAIMEGGGDAVSVDQSSTDGASVVTIKDNVIELVSPLGTASHGIVGIQKSNAFALTLDLSGNIVRGLSQANSDYAAQIYATGSAPLNYTVKDLLATGGYLRFGSEIIADASLYNFLFHRSTYDSGTVVWDPPNIVDGAADEGTVTVTGARFGDYVLVSAPYSIQGMIVTAYVFANDTVRIRIQNETGGAIDLPSGTWKVRVIK